MCHHIRRQKTSIMPLFQWVIFFCRVQRFFLIGFVFVAIAVIHVVTTELALTNRRIIAKSGLVRRNTVELKVNRVESLGVDQGVLGRIFNFGSISVKGVGRSNAPIPYISRPLEFRQQVNNYLDELDDQGKINL